MISVVILVTRDAVLNLSIFANENVCMLLNIPHLRFLANPVDAFAPVFAPITPTKSAAIAATSISRPYWTIFPMSPAWTPSSISMDMINGMSMSKITSMTMSIGVMMAARLYSRT